MHHNPEVDWWRQCLVFLHCPPDCNPSTYITTCAAVTVQSLPTNCMIWPSPCGDATCHPIWTLILEMCGHAPHDPHTLEDLPCLPEPEINQPTSRLKSETQGRDCCTTEMSNMVAQTDDYNDQTNNGWCFVAQTKDSAFFMCATLTISTCLAEATTKGTMKWSWKDLGLTDYHLFSKVFLKESFKELPQQWKWDHAIELIEGAEPVRATLSQRTRSHQQSLKYSKKSVDRVRECIQWQGKAGIPRDWSWGCQASPQVLIYISS
jgi:hypothetical protein